MRLELPFINTRRAGQGGVAEAKLADDQGIAFTQLGGRFRQAAREGRIFTLNDAAAGQVLPIFSATAQVFGIWNPADSGVNLFPLNYRGTYVSTTAAAGGFVVAVNKGIGSGLATGAISAFAETAPEKGIIATGGPANRCRGTLAATTIAPTIARSMGINQQVVTAADATGAMWNMKEDWDGDFGFGPGTALWIAGNIATLIRIAGSLTWMEEPV